jgi:hypothetical protein
MAATADKVGHGSATGHANYGDYRQTHSGSMRSYKTASPAARSLKPEEPSLPESCLSRVGYLRARKTVRADERIVFVHIAGRAMTEGRMDALPRAERPKPPQHPARQSSPDRAARQMVSAKAFAMHLEHLNFLKRVSSGDEAAITPEMASRATKAWHQIWAASGGRITVPSACTNADGKVFYSWDSDRYHLDLDIVPGEPAGFFFCDREADEYWCEDFNIGSSLPKEVVAKLALFA